MKAEQDAMTDTYPCGCVYTPAADGTYTHYVNPECRHDAGKFGEPVRGYRYAPWADRPQGEQS